MTKAYEYTLVEPSFTQPHKYKIIKNKPNVSEMYCKNLLQAGIISQMDVDVCYVLELFV